MTNYSYDAARMMAVVDQLEGTTQQIRAMLTELENDTQASLRAWEDNAKREYALCKQRWNEAAGRMPTLLGQVSTVLPAMLENLERGNRQGVDIWQGTPTGRR